MKLSINEYEPFEKAYEINISFIDREDAVMYLAKKLNEIADRLITFNETRNKEVKE